MSFSRTRLDPFSSFLVRPSTDPRLLSSQPSNHERQGMGRERLSPLSSTREARRQGDQGESLPLWSFLPTRADSSSFDFLFQIFAQNNIKTFDDLASDSMRIERLLSKKAPFGAQVRKSLSRAGGRDGELTLLVPLQLVEVIKGFPKFSLDVQ